MAIIAYVRLSWKGEKRLRLFDCLKCLHQIELRNNGKESCS
nr:MAG TPA: hypothetical protein [Caudoviricetes sp.]